MRSQRWGWARKVGGDLGRAVWAERARRSQQPYFVVNLAVEELENGRPLAATALDVAEAPCWEAPA